ncbi:MAG: nitrate/sulfonate/bicarbonate ABC transporter ATP-binding protein [Verrucomicrobia bacterium RIFCSPLOWO2_12_FULL_64_8]|nr:MAG: nitrate/sulfonate/bicarbonate ABC transporter ATP-binding protein [Verrucomicrobia bacterium RIFCSPLOWO2_12_FULL_64_8]
MTTVPVVHFASVTKRFGDGPLVLEGLDLDVAPGEFVSLIGPSGCGKSTLLRMVAALSPVTSGELLVAGVRPEQARAYHAFVFQESTLLPWLTAAGNVELPQRLRRVPAVERRRRALELLDLVRLRHSAALHPRQLSGGMKMRVSIARAMTLVPRLLLLDEPFGALDEITRNHLNEELLDWRAKSPFTALFVTHSVAEAVFLSNRILVMSARPGRFHVEVRVDFPDPRVADLRERPEYYAKVAEVSRWLHAAEEGAAA